ncbi:T9SS type A sorting domain-containing protein [candidate division KSB1 bacterium]|nr:T9SS type A sorting domain-containing protein [candidate division KSB1 bacterium]
MNHTIRLESLVFVLMLELFLLTTSAIGQSIKISWTPNAEQDVAFYLIYRDTVPNPLQRIAVIGAQNTSYIDHAISAGTTYYYRISTKDRAQNESLFSEEVSIVMNKQVPITNRQTERKMLNFGLRPNYPNPFNAETDIIYSIDQPGHVKITIFDILGRQVQQLVNKFLEPGNYQIKWNGLDNKGNPAPSGTYLVYLYKDGSVKTMKINLLR